MKRPPRRRRPAPASTRHDARALDPRWPWNHPRARRPRFEKPRRQYNSVDDPATRAPRPWAGGLLGAALDTRPPRAAPRRGSAIDPLPSKPVATNHACCESLADPANPPRPILNHDPRSHFALHLPQAADFIGTAQHATGSISRPGTNGGQRRAVAPAAAIVRRAAQPPLPAGRADSHRAEHGQAALDYPRLLALGRTARARAAGALRVPRVADSDSRLVALCLSDILGRRHAHRLRPVALPRGGALHRGLPRPRNSRHQSRHALAQRGQEPLGGDRCRRGAAHAANMPRG